MAICTGTSLSPPDTSRPGSEHGTKQDFADHPGAGSRHDRVAAALAAHPPRRPRGRDGRWWTGAGAEPPTRARRREADRRARCRWAAVVALAAAFVRVAARHRPRATGDETRTADGHADAAFTLRVYARDGRDDSALVDECSTARPAQESAREGHASGVPVRIGRVAPTPRMSLSLDTSTKTRDNQRSASSRAARGAGGGVSRIVRF